MKRKTLLVLFAVSCAVLLPGCSGRETEQVQDQEAQQPAWLEEFYTASYEYRITNIVSDEGTEQELPILEGKRINSPYRQYEKYINPLGLQAQSESYSYGDGEMVNTIVRNVQGDWTKQESKHDYPYGYGEDLEFTEGGTVDYNDIICDVYTTEYTGDMAEIMNSYAEEEVITEPLTAVIEQEYYVDQDTEQLVCMITDITDMNRKQQIAVFMVSKGITAKEAEQYCDTGQIREKMEILSYDDSMTIDIPDVDILTAEDFMPAE